MSFFPLLLSAADEYLQPPNLAPTRDFEQICFLFQSYMLPLHGVYPYKTHQTSFQCMSWDELLVPCPSLPSFSLLFSWSPLSISSHLQQKRDNKPSKTPSLSPHKLFLSVGLHPFRNKPFLSFYLPLSKASVSCGTELTTFSLEPFSK